MDDTMGKALEKINQYRQQLGIAPKDYGKTHPYYAEYLAELKAEVTKMASACHQADREKVKAKWLSTGSQFKPRNIEPSKECLAEPAGVDDPLEELRCAVGKAMRDGTWDMRALASGSAEIFPTRNIDIEWTSATMQHHFMRGCCLEVVIGGSTRPYVDAEAGHAKEGKGKRVSRWVQLPFRGHSDFLKFFKEITYNLLEGRTKKWTADIGGTAFTFTMTRPLGLFSEDYE